MASQSFPIAFEFEGEYHTADITYDTNGNGSFMVLLDAEETIEIYPDDPTEKGELVWFEVNGKKSNRSELLRVVGSEIEEYNGLYGQGEIIQIIGREIQDHDD